MNFTAKDVQALREKTGVGMMDCKKALVEADGDVEKAVEILREKGLASQAKKASRVAAEGNIGVYSDGTFAILLFSDIIIPPLIKLQNLPTLHNSIFRNSPTFNTNETGGRRCCLRGIISTEPSPQKCLNQ